jgi:hypothetical protein
MNRKRNPNLESIPAEGVHLNTTEKIEAYSQEYFATEFPNPERVGCPLPASLTAVARGMNGPDRVLQEHLFSCSECFNEFRSAMAPLAAAKVRWWEKLLAPGLRVPAMVAVGVLGVCIAVGVFVTQQMKQHPTQTATGNQENLASRGLQGSPNDSGIQPNATPTGLPERKGNSSASEGDVFSLVAVRVDLRRQVALGSIEREAQTAQNVEPIRLAIARTRINLTLPEGSAAGVYVISVLDRVSLNPVISARASSSNGKSLETILNLDRVKQGEYLLRVARGGESPSDFPLFVYRTDQQ